MYTTGQILRGRKLIRWVNGRPRRMYLYGGVEFMDLNLRIVASTNLEECCSRYNISLRSNSGSRNISLRRSGFWELLNLRYRRKMLKFPEIPNFLGNSRFCFRAPGNSLSSPNLRVWTFSCKTLRRLPGPNRRSPSYWLLVDYELENTTMSFITRTSHNGIEK